MELHGEYKETKESTFPQELNPSPTSATVESVGPTDYELQFYQVMCSTYFTFLYIILRLISPLNLNQDFLFFIFSSMASNANWMVGLTQFINV